MSPQAEARRDYELALQVGNKSAINAFLAQYPDGFYASLAKLQLDKISAEEARVAATEKARACRTGARASRRRRRAEGAAGQGRSGSEGGRAGARRGREGQAGGAGTGRCGRTEARCRRSRCYGKGCRCGAGSCAYPCPCRQGGQRRRARPGAGAARRHPVGAVGTAPRRLPDRQRRRQWPRSARCRSSTAMPARGLIPRSPASIRSTRSS